MRFIQSILAIIGALAIVIGGVGYTKYRQFVGALDPDAPRVFAEVYEKFAPTKDWADAMIWSFPVAKGISPEEVKLSLTSLAFERNFFFAGEAPFYKQAEAALGQPYRYVNFLSFCDARVGAMMIDYNEKYSAFMPCRLSTLYLMDSNRLMLLKNPIFEPPLPAHKAVVWDWSQNSGWQDGLFRSFHPFSSATGATIPSRIREGLASLASRRRF